MQNLSLKTVILISIFLASIGPVLSFFSLQKQLSYSINIALLYAFSTYILDFFHSFILGFFLYKNSNLDFKDALKLSLFLYYPIWIFDFTDINQYLRPFSNIGLLISLFFIFKILKNKLERNKLVFLAILHIILYILNALVAESIALNPVLKKLMEV